MNYFTHLAGVTIKYCIKSHPEWTKKQRRNALVPMIVRHLEVKQTLKRYKK